MNQILNPKDCIELPMRGSTHGILRDRSGRVVHEDARSNNIVTAIRVPIIKLLGGYLAPNYAQLPFVNQMKFGTGNTAPTAYQTGLVTPLQDAVKVLPAAPTISQDGLQVTYSVVFGENELNDVTMREAGLFTSDNTMVARSVIGEYHKLAGMFFEFYWTIGFDAQSNG